MGNPMPRLGWAFPLLPPLDYEAMPSKREDEKWQKTPGRKKNEF